MDYMQQLEGIAAEMNRIRATADPEMQYSIMSDAIVWSDEYPNDLTGRTEDFECIKILLRYRTSLLTGQPNESFRPYWERAIELFPNWAGFEPSRLAPSNEKTKFYEKRSERDMQNLNRILGRCATED
jgi:hypothetical protein